MGRRAVSRDGLNVLTSSHVESSICFAPAISVSDTTRYFRRREICRQLESRGAQWAWAAPAGARSLSFLYYYNRLATTPSVFRLKNRFAFESPESDRPVRQWFQLSGLHATQPQPRASKLSNEQDCPSRGDCDGPRAPGRGAASHRHQPSLLTNYCRVACPRGRLRAHAHGHARQTPN